MSSSEKRALLNETFGLRQVERMMPHLLGGAPPLETVTFPDNLVIRCSFETERAAIERLLPPQVALVGEPIATFVYRHSKGLDWVVGGKLNLLGLSIRASFAGAMGVEGAYWPVLWENDAMAVALGREVMGVAKLFGAIDNPRTDGTIWQQRLLELDQPLIEMNFCRGQQLSGEALDRVRDEALQGKVIGFKHVPNANLSGAELAHATHYQSPNKIASAWSGDGDIVVHAVDHRKHPWTAPVLDALRSLPRGRCIAALMLQGSGEHRIGQGRDL